VIGSPAEVGALIRARVRTETGLACSVGAAATKFVAKLASGRAKPDGLLVIPKAETLAFLHPLPVGALWGVGAVTEKSLLGRGLHTIGDIAGTPVGVLRRIVGEAGAAKLHALANGVDPRRVTRDAVEKSVGHEVTFEIDVSDAAVLRRELLRQATQVGSRLRASGLEGRTVVLKLRYGDFTTITRSRTLAEPTDVGRRIADEVRSLYDALGAHPPVRLIGVRMEQLAVTGATPQGLWDEDEEWRGAERVIDDVGERFGRDLVRPASLLRPTAELGPSKRRPHLDD
jgi:DNA polymerase-4